MSNMEIYELCADSDLVTEFVKYEDHAAIVAQLEADLADARKDQARYQWLASQYKCVSLDMGGNNAYKLPHFPANIRGLDVNSIIDAAIAAKDQQ